MVLSKEEIRKELLGDLDSEYIMLTLENLTLKDLENKIVQEHSFSYFQIPIEFTSKANKRYQAFFYYFADSHSRIDFYGLDKDREDFKSVVKIFAKETDGELQTIKRKTGILKRTIQEIDISDVERGETSGTPEGIFTDIALPELLTQEKLATYVERLGEHFKDVKILKVTFNNVPLSKISKNYLEELYVSDVQGILERIDEYIAAVVQGGAEGASEYYREGLSLDPSLEIPLWMKTIWDFQGTDEEVLGKLRDLKELYRQVIAEIGQLEPVSESEEEAVEEAQVPTDKGIEWVRDTFLNNLEILEVSLGEDFFIFEEKSEGRVLVKGRGYIERQTWGALNDMVRKKLGGRYDSTQRGWIIDKQ